MADQYPSCYCPDCGSLMVEVRRWDGLTYFACLNKKTCGREVWAVVLHRPSTHPNNGTQLADNCNGGMIHPMKSGDPVRQVPKEEMIA